MVKPPQISHNPAVVFATRQEYILHQKYYLNTKQQREIITTFGYVSLIILEHYLRKASLEDNNFNDDLVAHELGIPVRTVKYARQKLAKANWFIQRTFRNTGSKPLTVTAIGQQRVQALKACTTESFQQVLNEYLTSERAYDSAN